MKKFLLLSIVAVFLFSCNKLTESNIVGEWKVTAAKINGFDQTIMGEGIYEFAKGGTYTYKFNGVTQGTGSYTVDKDAQTITMDGQVITVSEKKGKTMTWTFSDGIDNYEFTMEKQ